MAKQAGNHATEEGVVIGTSDGRRALLADFDVGSHELRPKHRIWLDGLAKLIRRSHLKPPDGVWHITTTGRASKSGSNAFNAALSDRRALEVQWYLESRIGPVLIQWNRRALGEEVPHDEAIDENARDRSVEVFASPNVFVEPPPPRRDPRPPLAEKAFDLVVNNYVCIVGEGTFIRFTSWIINLTISDPETDLAQQYNFEGGGTSAPVATKFLVTSVQIRSFRNSSPQLFHASNRLTVDSFVGDAGLVIPAFGPSQFRFGGKKRTDFSGPKKFPRGEIDDFILPKADRNLPAKASASGQLARGVADTWF